MHRTIERIGPEAPPYHLEVVPQFATQSSYMNVYHACQDVSVSDLSGFHTRKWPNQKLYVVRSTDHGGARCREGNPGSVLTLASDLLQCIFDLIDLILAPHLIFTSHMIFQ